MHTFNLQKFLKDGVAETRDGHLKVLRYWPMSNERFGTNLISTHGEAGMSYQIYNKDGLAISINGEIRTKQKHMRLVNE